MAAEVLGDGSFRTQAAQGDGTGTGQVQTKDLYRAMSCISEKITTLSPSTLFATQS